MIAASIALLTQGIPAGEAPPPSQSTCDAPVYMVVEGLTLDRERMGEYARAIAESEIYQKLGGYYVTAPRPLAVFEGDVPDNYVNLTVRFPCLANARAFWNSKVYQEEIIKLRQNPSAGDYTVTVYAEAPLREDMVGRVETGRFVADFADHGVPQIEQDSDQGEAE
ncbi:DUF1330 domain-containing protein [Altererythrobacter lutimaris]|uniref:DUF1330 domain-containing protein n=1 Tax=Altererythrobacter lutimaris TaxID=2743979 RepID=A0A850HDT3_9SPHN|nr:DUF1330 domain-containing protein [Altererythrobacter lutimaris]NVE95575.1 DUF1330 domain-containing protein [Altererythrobacter lutimaris]